MEHVNKIQVNEKIFSDISTGKLDVIVLKLTEEVLVDPIIQFYTKMHYRLENDYGSYHKSCYQESELYSYDILIKKAKGLHKGYAVVRIKRLSAFVTGMSHVNVKENRA